jgi:hypothetical protein
MALSPATFAQRTHAQTKRRAPVFNGVAGGMHFNSGRISRGSEQWMLFRTWYGSSRCFGYWVIVYMLQCFSLLPRRRLEVTRHGSLSITGSMWPGSQGPDATGVQTSTLRRQMCCHPWITDASNVGLSPLCIHCPFRLVEPQQPTNTIYAFPFLAFCSFPISNTT